jgi:hypothetical protein
MFIVLNLTIHSFVFAEDIDPSIGRFRNLVSTTVIPTKVSRRNGEKHLSASFFFFKKQKKNFQGGWGVEMVGVGEEQPVAQW